MIIVVIIVVVLLLGLGLGSYFLFFRKSETSSDSSESSSVVVPPQKSKKVQYVKLLLPGNNRVLHFTEVEVFNDANLNVAMNKNVVLHKEEKSYGRNPNLVVNGKILYSWAQGDMIQSVQMANPYLEIDLAQEEIIKKIKIHNRVEPSHNTHEISNPLNIILMNANKEVVYEKTNIKAVTKVIEIDIPQY